MSDIVVKDVLPSSKLVVYLEQDNLKTVAIYGGHSQRVSRVSITLQENDEPPIKIPSLQEEDFKRLVKNVNFVMGWKQ